MNSPTPYHVPCDAAVLKPGSQSSYIARLDGTAYPPIGWVDGHWVQLGHQLAGVLAAFAWSFVLTCLILFLMNLVPGLSLRVSADDEDVGIDDCQLGEFAYDYVELTRHVADTTSTVSERNASSDASTAANEKVAPTVAA